MNTEIFLTLSFPITALTLWFVVPYMLFGEIGIMGAIFAFVACWVCEYNYQNT